MGKGLEKIIIHCSATRNGEDCLAKEIKKWHLRRGFKDIGYHFVIQPNGLVEKGRQPFVNEKLNAGAHCKGENHDSLGICMVGDDKFTPVQFKALKTLIENYSHAYDVKPWNIHGHRDFAQGKKTCPNILTTKLLIWYLFDTDDPIKDHIMSY